MFSASCSCFFRCRYARFLSVASLGLSCFGRPVFAVQSSFCCSRCRRFLSVDLLEGTSFKGRPNFVFDKSGFVVVCSSCNRSRSYLSNRSSIVCLRIDRLLVTTAHPLGFIPAPTIASSGGLTMSPPLLLHRRIRQSITFVVPWSIEG